MQLRYIKYNPPNMFTNKQMNYNYTVSLFEYAKNQTITNPTIFAVHIIFDKPHMHTANIIPYSEHIYIDRVPSDVTVTRLYLENFKNGPLVYNGDSLFYFITLPKSLDIDLNRNINLAISSTLRDKGINSYVRHEHDYYVIQDGKQKKFGGYVSRIFGDYQSTALFISLDVDIDLMNNIYRFDTEKIRQYGITDIGDIVCGLHSVSPNITGEEIMDTISTKFAEYLGLDLINDNLTLEEMSIQMSVAEKYNDNNWRYLGIYPEGGE